MRKDLKTELLFILVIILFALSGHLLFNLFFPFLSIGLIFLLLWHLYQLHRFYRYFTHQHAVNTIHPFGLWVGIYQQVADYQQRWLHYRRNLATFQRAFKRFPHAIFILDNRMRISWFNEASEKIITAKSHILNHMITEIIDHPILAEYLFVKNFEQPLEIESPLDKSTILSLQFYPLGRHNSKSHKNTLLVIEDITHSYHLNQTRKDFISNVTHELKTPLTVFTGFLEPMCEDISQFPDLWKANINLMYQQSLRMNDIVTDLLLLSKMEITQTPASNEEINMPLLLEKSIDDAKLLSQQSTHQFSVQIQSDLYLRGEENSIKAIINNLLVNAIKYTPPYCKISLTWELRSDQAYLVIQDSGEGIAPRHLPRLTERFYRVESDRSREKGGSGLGLAIVNHALQRHQGELKISSEIGRGSSFCCIFPKHRVNIQGSCKLLYND